jgi:transposase-like protein
MRTQPNTAKRQRGKWGASKKPLNTPPSKRANVVGMYLSGAKIRAISRELGLDRETVTRILSQQENQLLLQGFRQAVLRIVPNALVGLSHLVNQLDRTAIIEVLYGARVLIDRHEVATVQEPERTYDSAKVAFYEKYGHWPTHEEAVKFDRTIVRKPTVKGELTE